MYVAAALSLQEICQILQDDNIEQQIAFTQRLRLEDDLYREDRKEDLFNICGLNFIRNTLEERINSYAFYDCLKYASKDELVQFFKVRKW